MKKVVMFGVALIVALGTGPVLAGQKANSTGATKSGKSCCAKKCAGKKSSCAGKTAGKDVSQGCSRSGAQGAQAKSGCCSKAAKTGSKCGTKCMQRHAKKAPAGNQASQPTDKATVS